MGHFRGDDEATGGGWGQARECVITMAAYHFGVKENFYGSCVVATRGHAEEDVTKHLQCQFQTNKSFPSYKHAIEIEGSLYA